MTTSTMLRQGNEQVLATALDKAREQAGAVLGAAIADTVFPKDRILTNFGAELYRTPALAAAQTVKPGVYPLIDGSLTSLSFEGGTRVFMVEGKAGSDEEVHFDGGADPRQTRHTIYTYDGAGTITEYTPGGEPMTYTGKLGNPDALLSDIKPRLGELVAAESYSLDS